MKKSVLFSSLASVSLATTLAPYQNGTCYTYHIKSGDTCSEIADKYDLTVEKIQDFNENHTLLWKGCDKLLVGQAICLSEGDTPRPTPDPDAQCGIYAPGDKFNSTCPLNGCCSEFGYCGVDEDHCGANCYSQCGFGNLHDDPPAKCFHTSAYWMDKKCNETLYQNVKDLDGEYDILFYAFAEINEDMTVKVEKGFEQFCEIEKSKKIVSMGGWDFSTGVNTYQRFRDAIKSSEFVDNVVDFITEHDLDGINFDWEYPSQPDIAGIPAGLPEEGNEYYKTMAAIREKLPDTSISVAIPASYWYLKAYPLEDMAKVVDFFVLMAYDYHGQWDYTAGTGVMCHTNKTNIDASLAVLDKANIPFSKVYGGLANYAKSFKLKDENCIKPGCPFTGPESGADPGPITNTAGIMSENEALSAPFNEQKTWWDSQSWCQIMVWTENDNWMAWTDKSSREAMSKYFRSIGVSGTALWSTNYELPVKKQEPSRLHHLHRN